MTSRHWQIFVAVADCGTMSEAARRMTITQPSISQAISDIEREYGVLLFSRVGKRLRLTETGQDFLPYAKRMLSLEKEADEFLRSAADAKRLRVGATVTVGTCLIAPLLEELSRRIPAIRTEVSVANTARIESRLLSGELDMGLVEGQVSSPELLVEHVIRDELVFICGESSPLWGRESISLTDLAGQSLILREAGSGTRAQLEYHMRRRSVPADVRWDCCNTEAILTAVSRGHGVSVLSRRLVDGSLLRRHLWAAPIADEDFSRHFDLVYHKDRLVGEEMRTFARICRDFEAGLLPE